MDSKQVLMLLVVAVCAVTCRPLEKDESSIRKNPSIGIVHIRFISDAGVDELLGIFNPEALQRSLDKLPEKIPSSELDKPIENPLEQKKSEPNVERPPMEKDDAGNPVRVIEEREREKNPVNMPKEREPMLENPDVHLPEQKEREPILENPMEEREFEKETPEREQILRRREVRKNPLETESHQTKLLHESPDKLQEQKVSKDFIKKEESHHEIPVENPLEPKLGSENVNLEKPKLGSENVNVEKPKLGSENVNLEKPKLGSEKEHLEKPKLGSENPEERKERPDVLRESEEQHEKERSEESKESEEERRSESFPSILLPPKVMSKRRRSVLDGIRGLPMDDGVYDERSRYRLPGSTDIQFSEDRPRYGMSGTYGDMSRYRVDDPYGDSRYGRLGGMDRPIYDDRYGSYGSDTLVDIQMK
ncbi:hypothetical protein GHT06_015961 [Daphnia sinensis]|uniref:Uncharacterized protein n=1 Tax=Daphnia sinensis TaxID=1820382 RepID=A0AAD5PTV7_9CRUS|nr:hypothetical protein GHT06_015961 [Daphnia sinensis]